MASPFSSVRRGVTAIASLAALMFFCLCARASGPYKADVTQQSAPEYATHIDHLLPFDRYDAMTYHSEGPQGANYLAWFIESPFVMGNFVDPQQEPPDETTYFVVFREKEGHYILRTGPLRKNISLWPKTPKGCTDVVIPESMAEIICQIWMKELLETRHDRRRDIVGIPHDTTFLFSVWNPSLGELDATIQGADAYGYQLPPHWLIDTGDALMNFATDPRRDSKKMEAKLAATRDKLFHYLRWHGVH